MRLKKEFEIHGNEHRSKKKFFITLDWQNRAPLSNRTDNIPNWRKESKAEVKSTHRPGSSIIFYHGEFQFSASVSLGYRGKARSENTTWTNLESFIQPSHRVSINNTWTSTRGISNGVDHLWNLARDSTKIRYSTFLNFNRDERDRSLIFNYILLINPSQR